MHNYCMEFHPYKRLSLVTLSHSQTEYSEGQFRKEQEDRRTTWKKHSLQPLRCGGAPAAETSCAHRGHGKLPRPPTPPPQPKPQPRRTFWRNTLLPLTSPPSLLPKLPQPQGDGQLGNVSLLGFSCSNPKGSGEATKAQGQVDSEPLLCPVSPAPQPRVRPQSRTGTWGPLSTGASPGGGKPSHHQQLT